MLYTGCSSGSQNVKKEFAFEENSKTGLMVISVRYEPNENCLRPMNTLALSYRGFGNESEAGLSNALLNIKNPMIPYDFEQHFPYYLIWSSVLSSKHRTRECCKLTWFYR